MQNVYAVGSATNAMRGKRLLEKHGVRAYIRKLRADRTHGCGYGLLVMRTDVPVVSLLNKGGVAVLDVRESEET